MPRLRHDPKNRAAVAATRQRLLDAACEEFLEIAYFETDTNKIARRAGLSPGTFYNHFPNKIEIFIAAFERLSNEESLHIARVCTSCFRQGGSLPEVARVFTETLIESRRRLRLLRLQGEILRRTEPKVFECTRTVQQQEIAIFQKQASELGLKASPVDELFVRNHVLNTLADAVAFSEFQQWGVSDQQARKEIMLQLLRCFDQESGDVA